MPSTDKSITPLAAVVTLPVLLVVAGAIAAVVISLQEMATVVDETEMALTRRSAEAAVAAAVRRKAVVVADYAHWDDAVRNVYGEPNIQFLAENLGDSTADPRFFDTAYVLEWDGSLVAAYRHGEAVDVAPERAFGPDLTQMIADLPTDGVTFDARAAVVSGRWGLAIMAVAPVVPISSDVSIPEPGKPRFLAISRAFDLAAVRDLGNDYLIDRLSWGGPLPEASNRAPVMDYNGDIVGWLTWNPRQLGAAAHAQTQPIALTMLGLLAVVVLLLVVVAMHGIVRLQRQERASRHAASHDALTGLPNRAAFSERLANALAAIDHGGPPVAVAYLDLDGFKDVNDAYGHGTGDRLLTNIAESFRAICEGRFLARMSGDEFAIIVGERDAMLGASRIADRLVDFFHEPLQVDGHTIHLGASVGVVAAPDSRISVEELLRRADVAMYTAKRTGRGRMCIFDHTLDTARMRRTAIADRLARALAADHLQLVYQPIFDARTHSIAAVEALLRWPEGEADVVSTPEAIAIAEEAGLIDAIGRWVLGRACSDARPWGDVKVSVNVSPAQIQHPTFPDMVAGIIEETGFPPERLELELTENFFIERPEQAAAAIDALRRLGVTLALDDFGAGFSSIGHLRTFAFDKVKIDRSLVAHIDTNRQAQDLVQATVHIGRALGLTVVAEGIETEAEAFLLRAAGCHQFQGFFFASPETAHAFGRRLAASAAPALAETA